MKELDKELDLETINGFFEEAEKLEDKKETVTKDDKETVTKDGKKDALAVWKSLIPQSELDAKRGQWYLKTVRDQLLGSDKPLIDLEYFLFQAKQRGLDPLKRQIYAIYYWDRNLGREKMTVVVGIDGFRVLAERTGLYGGSSDATYEIGADGLPVKATITVYKINQINGSLMPTSASAYWSEYVKTDKTGKPSSMWAKMPFVMISKVAEALALRKCFPDALSGLYTDDEMQQATNQNNDENNLQQ